MASPNETGRRWQWLMFIALIASSCQRHSPSTGEAATHGTKATSPPAVPERPTYAEHVAPLLHRHCATCHRPGESGPFSLLTYSDAAERAKLIAQVTTEGIMPPWLPARDGAHYEGETLRRLSPDQIALLSRWAEQGATEGDRRLTPQSPAFTPGWHLGTPDLTVSLPTPYELAAEGTDEYRHFVIPLPLGEARHIQALEFRPRDAADVIHHAFMLFDQTRESRRLDTTADSAPGYPGMDPGNGAQSPSGHFISWQPGKLPQREAPGYSWTIQPGTDLVLQVHLRPQGKRRVINPEIGFYFTADAPRHRPLKLVLMSNDIDIPAGQSDWSFEQRYRLPVAVEVRAVIPHAHYLGKQLHAWAEIPGSDRREWLCKIDRWDFAWQGDYRFSPTVQLPAGSTLIQHFTYDNSAQNPHNPHRPPIRVRRGLNTTDEMGELWLQVVPLKDQDRPLLERDYTQHAARQRRSDLEKKVSQPGHSGHDLEELAKACLVLGEPESALRHAQAAESQPGASAEAAYIQGFLHSTKGDSQTAVDCLQRALKVNPRHPAALNGLGLVHLQRGEPAAAADALRQATQADPLNPTPWQNLAKAYRSLGDAKAAQAAMIEAAKLTK